MTPRSLLSETFNAGGNARLVAAPGRLNLIGEHIDYHGMAVLPMALRQSIQVAFRARSDGWIRTASESFGVREFEWKRELEPVKVGDWENYVRAAACAVSGKWGVGRGVDAAMVSSLPAAAGLSSSSALLVACTLCLLAANGIAATFEELMEVLPDGEQFVGTRGGGMDHAASLGSRAGCASLISFDPVTVRHVAIPDNWAFLAAHSLTAAEKSGAVRERYNACRTAGTAALARLGIASYREASPERAAELDGGERRAYEHVVTESRRVGEAVTAMERGDASAFGSLLLESHASLRDRLHVSTGGLDRLVEAAVASGALGARLTGAGFGGCAVVLCRRADLAQVRRGLIQRYYAGLPEFDERAHLIEAEAGPGALQMLEGA